MVKREVRIPLPDDQAAWPVTGSRTRNSRGLRGRWIPYRQAPYSYLWSPGAGAGPEDAGTLKTAGFATAGTQERLNVPGGPGMEKAFDTGMAMASLITKPAS